MYCVGLSRSEKLPIGQMQEFMDAPKLFEVENLEANWQGLTSYECPCMCYHGARTQIRSTIKRHSRQHGRDPYFQCPMVV
jgi:hypothetical protein